MDKHHKVRIMVAGLTGYERDKAMLRYLSNPQELHDGFLRKLRRIKRRKQVRG